MKLSKKFIAVPALTLAAGISLAACGSSGGTAGTSSTGPVGTNTLPNIQVCPQGYGVYTGLKCGNLNDQSYLASIIKKIVATPQYQSGSPGKIDPSQFDAMFSANGGGTADVVQIYGSDQSPEIISALSDWIDNNES
jgi:hypothetical protein